MISVKFYLRDAKAKKQSAIRMSTSFKGNRLVVCTGHSIDTSHWDSKNCFPKSLRGNSYTSVLTTKLKKLEADVHQLYLDLNTSVAGNISHDVFEQKVRQLINPEKNTGENSNKISLISFVELFIKDSEKGIRLKYNQYRIEENSIKPYRTTKKHIEDFERMTKRTYLISDLNQDFHDDFSDFLIEDLNLSKNSHSKYIMVLCQIAKYAVKKKLLPLSFVNEIKFNTSREESDNIYLTEKEIDAFMRFKDFKNKGEEVVRDIFVIGCYTGMRFGNYSKINIDNIRDNILHIIQEKTKKPVSIPIHEHVKKIIDKYDGKLPKCPTNQEFNRTLKDIGKRIPELNTSFTKQITRGRTVTAQETKKWELLMTHTARRSFCTNMYLSGIPILTIMAVSGHKTEKSFRAYIKVSGEEHARIMERFWNKEGTKVR